MTISSSLNAGVAGLSANATRLATISDNIANSATNGYKRAEADFASMVTGSGGSTYAAGGVRVTTGRAIDQSGTLKSTSNATDLAVRGRGFIPVTPETGIGAAGGGEMLLTTTGSFKMDADGLLKTANGHVLMGWPANADGEVTGFSRDTTAGLQPIRIERNAYVAEPTTRMDLGINLPATATEPGASGDTLELSVEYFDNMGTSQTLDLVFTPTVPGAAPASNNWTLDVTDTATGSTFNIPNLQFSNLSGTGGDLLTVNGNPPENPITVNVGPNADPIDIYLGGDRAGLTQLSDTFAPTSISKNGTEAGSVFSIEVDQNGYVLANYDTGAIKTLYQVPLVDMPNPNGLETLDSQTYRTTKESGSFFLWDAGTGPTGELESFALEESTVDVAGELTSLIQTQRAYSSNAKVIQTVDEMLQETTNIKR